MDPAQATALAAELDSWLAATLSVLSVVLGAIAVGLTALGLVVAVAAIFGGKAISTLAQDRARKAAEERLDAIFDSAEIRKMIQERVAAEADDLFPELAMALAYYAREQTSLESKQSVGQLYPDNKEGAGDDSGIGTGSQRHD